MKRRLLALAISLVLASAFAVFLKQNFLSQGDPDRYYHVALSRLTAESGRVFLRSLPQVEDLGWGEDFVDKEFLFHFFTTLGYRAAGKAGVEYTSLAFAVLSLLVFFAFAASRVRLSFAAGLSLLVFSSPYLAARLSLLRPHTLAILAFFLMNLAVLSRKPKLTALACFLFVLSYHAFYVPIACMAGLFALSYLDEAAPAREWRQLSLFGLFGSVAGVLANPYFPGTIALAAIHARIPELMQGELKGASFGEELVPVRSDIHLRSFHGCMLVVLLAVFLLGLDSLKRDAEAKALRVRLVYLLSVAGFFLAVSFQITRAGEYLIPACGLILLLVIERWSRYGKIVSAALAVAVVAQVAYAASLFRANFHPTGDDRVRETFRAVAAIPETPKGAKLFNCEWDRTPYVLYARPDLRFIDILDPSLLYFANAGAYRAREELRQGTTADAYGLIRNAFKADYVICGDPSVNAQLRTDPGFQQVYPTVLNPAQSGIVPSVFRVVPEPVRNYVNEYELSEPTSVDEAILAAMRPPSSRTGRKELVLEKSPYLNLAAVLLKKQKQTDPMYCAFVSPLASEMRRLEGATFLGIGGGQGLKVWRNGRPLFSTRAGFPSAHLIQVLVDLGSPLSRNDHLDVLSCSGANSPFWGVALSLWSRSQMAEECREKAAFLATPKYDYATWPYQGLQGLTCLGPLAAPAQPRELLSNPHVPESPPAKEP